MNRIKVDKNSCQAKRVSILCVYEVGGVIGCQVSIQLQARFFYQLLGQITVADHFMLSMRSIAVTDDGKSAHFFVYQIGFLEESIQVGA